jgi:hypothetical protein|tara:strand:- start:368 stop:979 length:612 start_codon:yes stop_codon:yes gene_type:complete
MATTTTDTDTELSAVNSILGAIGQAPITTLNYENPEISFIYNILTEVNKDVQNEGWHFNTEYHVKVTPDSNKNVTLPVKTLRYDLHDHGSDKTQDLVVRDGKLYDLVDHTDEFDTDLYLDVVTLYGFADLPNPFQRYITYRAAARAATQLVSNPQLVQLLQQQEAQSRATCMEYECNQGDHNYMGWDHGTNYVSYKPTAVLAR